MPEVKLRFGEILVRAGLLDETHLKAALAEQRKWGGRLGRILVEMGFVDEPTVVAALSRHLGIPAIDLEASPPPMESARLVPVQDCERYGVFPIVGYPERKVLKLATSDPTNVEALQQIEFRTGMKIEPVIASITDIERAIRRYYYGDSPERSGGTMDLPDDSEQLVVESGVRLEEAAEVPPPPAIAAPGDLQARVAKLEELADRQARALRALVEMLVEDGKLDRSSFVKRVRGDPK